ncbi:MAG: hypothetical protein WCA16_20360, partial [Candidatus Sulfotelmatobacter sp.]
GMSAAQLSNAGFNVDPYGAVGTKQFVQYVNTYYQAYSKTAPYGAVWSAPQPFDTPFTSAGLSNCYAITGDGVIEFDRMASRWVLGAHTSVFNNYYYCLAVSNTDDLASPTLSWSTYAIALDPLMGKNSRGDYWFPDWPKLGVWSDGYYLGLDLNDRDNNFQEVGILVCALDRSNLLAGLTPRAPQCFETPSPVTGALYLAHSPIPAEIDGTTAPPAGREEYLVSIENPPNDGHTTTSSTFNLWAFHVDWSKRTNTTFTHSTIAVAAYTPGCYDAASVTATACVPQPSTGSSGQHIDSVGDRFMPRFAYRNFGTYESFLVSHTVQVGTGGSQQTGIRWYELRGSGTPALYQEGNVSPDRTTYRFVPSIAQDHSGNAAVGYSVSSGTTHPTVRASSWSLPNHTKPIEFGIVNGTGDDENTWKWGSYTSMTVDPVDGCTFWYTNEYFPKNQTGSNINWFTRIGTFKIAGCQ